jgi:PEP-CTERM motif
VRRREAVVRNDNYKILRFVALVTLLLLTAVTPAVATPFFFSTGNVTDLIATASRPESSGKLEIESADDFVLTAPTNITSATFTGLLTGGASTSNIGQVVVEIYRVFPSDSDVGRTSGAPTFSTPQVPTRVNSPSDVALVSVDLASGKLSLVTNVLTQSFTANTSVLNGIHPKPNQTTGGDGPVTGQEVVFDVTFATPISLADGHYFFVPQVEVTNPDGEFYWLSGSRPIVAPGTPFAPDLQSWIRNENLDPDWLRIGTDIVGGTTFNAAFSLNGEPVPEPATMLLLGTGLVGLAGLKRRFKK